MIREALYRPSDTEDWEPPSKVKVDPYETQKRELISLFSRSIHDLGDEEIRWLISDKNWKELYQSILEITDSLYRSNKSYIEIVKNKRFDIVCECLSQSISNKLKINIPCNVKQIEYYYQNKY